MQRTDNKGDSTMATKTTYFAAAPDGTIVTRTTARTYTHAILVGPDKTGGRKDRWGAWSFNGREDLAVKELKRASEAWAGRAEVVMVPCHAKAAKGTEGWSLLPVDEAPALVAEGVPNPVIATRPARDGGTARLRLDGLVDAEDGVLYSLSPGFDSYEELDAWIVEETAKKAKANVREFGTSVPWTPEEVAEANARHSARLEGLVQLTTAKGRDYRINEQGQPVDVYTGEVLEL